MSSPRWHWSLYSGTQYLLQSETHNIPCHALQTRPLHLPQCSAGRPLHCRRSSCLSMIFENPIESWNLSETKHVGLPILIKALFHFRLHPCKHNFKFSPGLLHFIQLKSISSELWSSELRTQFKQLRIEAWKSQDFNGVWTRDLAISVRRSNHLSY